MLESIESDHVDIVHSALPPLALGHSAILEAEFDISEHCAPGKEIEMLKHHTSIESGPVCHFGPDEHLARGWLGETIDDPQERRLAATTVTDQTVKSVLLHGEGNVLERVKILLLGLKDLTNVPDFHIRH